VHTLIFRIARRLPVLKQKYRVQKSIGLPMRAQEPQVCRSGWEEDVSDERDCLYDEYEKSLLVCSVGVKERYFFFVSRKFAKILSRF
jgi:hypothetical protein